MDAPLVFTTNHRVQFSDLDPYAHMSTAVYAGYFVDHRMEGLSDNLGWDLATMEKAPFMVWVRRLEIDFLRPAQGYQKVTITSFVREFRGPDAHIECKMADESGRELARCQMIVAYVDKATRRAASWPPETMALFFVKE